MWQLHISLLREIWKERFNCLKREKYLLEFALNHKTCNNPQKGILFNFCVQTCGFLFLLFILQMIILWEWLDMCPSTTLTTSAKMSKNHAQSEMDLVKNQQQLMTTFHIFC